MSTLQDVLAEIEEAVRLERHPRGHQPLEHRIETPGFVDCRGVFHAWDGEGTE